MGQGEFKFTILTEPHELRAWLASHGHRAIIGPPGDPESPGGIVFDHGPGTSLQMAFPGDTLTVRPNGTIAVN
jgi:uncharacterized protein YndB with AHSA1/START domain